MEGAKREQTEEALKDYAAGRTTDVEGLDQATAKTEKTHKKKSPEQSAAVSKTAIGKAVLVVTDIVAHFGSGGGQGDGLAILPTGSQIWLVDSDGELVDYLSGPKPPGPYGEGRSGGFFPVRFLGNCKDLEVQKKTPEQLAAVAKIKEAIAARQARPEEATQSVWARGRRTIGFEGLDDEGQLAEIARLEAEPIPKRPIGKAVRVVKDIPTYLSMGGWGDGPSWLRTGAKIWLLSSEDGLVDWVSGPKPPVAGEGRAGNGFFPVRFLTHVEDLPNA